MDTARHILRNYRYPAMALVTVLTLAIVGVVVLYTTSAGCGPANKLGVKTAICAKGGPVGYLGSPSPTGGKGLQSPSSSPYYPSPSTIPPYDPGASSYPPYDPGASAGNPYNPYSGPASGAYPPMASPTSGGAPPGVALSCRLPVFAGGPGSGGFIVFPGQTFIADPRSAVTAPSPSPGSASPTPPPQYGPGYPAGWYGLTYDAMYSKWVPVPWAWVSPDGLHYAYPLAGDVYVQNVANGTQFDLGQGHGYGVLDVENDGVYATQPNQPGLWFLPYSGTARQVSATGFWQAASHGAAYGSPTSQVPQGATNTIEKLDLKTGALVAFFTQPGGQSSVIGFDLQGHPVIQVYYPNSNAIYVATGPGTSTVIAGLYYGGYNGPYPSGTPIADSHGLWFSAGNGIVLFSNGAWYWMASIGGQLSGQCL